jgi:hypothetical protein
MGISAMMTRVAAKYDLIEQMMATLDVRDRFAGLPGGGEALRNAVVRCMTCSKPDACSAWVAKHRSADEAPDFCRNHDLFARLREHAGGRAD